MDTHVDWDQLVDALRDELQEKGGLIQLLNQQTEILYRRSFSENERVEDQIRSQLRLTTRCTQNRELILRQTASRMELSDDVETVDILNKFPEYVQPLLNALFNEVDRLSGRMDERLRQNQQLKNRFFASAVPVA